ncbi:FAD-dependent oxidoreductase [Ideonella sp. DXS29W]|uniref:FAD-dependent oxidoreductase n=1 Tax=Ideonella lacteola TaxID=2984193 RepID=A0ABU9BKZ9_9BURK
MSGASVARRRVAVVGSGIAGLSAAWHLATEQADQVSVTLFEADGRFGGHAHTVDVTLDGQTHGVDTGFLVFNERTYPGLIGLFEQLGVPTAGSDMSFSVQSADRRLEWCGHDLNGVFAQRSNLASPRFWGMLSDILRFNRLSTGMAERGDDRALQQSVGDFLDEHRFGAMFRDAYFLPMIGSIWSCPTAQMQAFPIGTLIRFCHNHGLLQVQDRPRWFTVTGGSREYVRRVLERLPDARLNCPVRAVRRQPPGPQGGQAGVWIDTDAGSERFDAVVLAGHAPQSLALLPDASADERQVLGAIRTQPNRAVLHTDARLLPQRQRAWAAWNYEAAATSSPDQVCLHYLINRLQPLPWSRPVIVSLNPLREPDPAQVHGEFSYAHPVFDRAAVEAQRRLPSLQGAGGVWFAGAWTRYGFHEDGMISGQSAARSIARQWAGTSWREAA